MDINPQEYHHSQHVLFDGNCEKALASIKAQAIAMPGQTDLYFPPEDSEYEVRHISNVEFQAISSI